MLTIEQERETGGPKAARFSLGRPCFGNNFPSFAPSHLVTTCGLARAEGTPSTKAAKSAIAYPLRGRSPVAASTGKFLKSDYAMNGGRICSAPNRSNRLRRDRGIRRVVKRMARPFVQFSVPLPEVTGPPIPAVFRFEEDNPSLPYRGVSILSTGLIASHAPPIFGEKTISGVFICFFNL